MKSTILKAVACGALMIAASAALFAQSPVPRIEGGVGPAVAGSIEVTSLPQSAIEFVGATFPGAVIVECEREFADNTFEVQLADGTDIEFDNDGNWIEVDAGRVKRLPEAVVKMLLPEKAYAELSRRKMTANVESVKRDRRGYKVELREVDYENFNFSPDGKLKSHSMSLSTARRREISSIRSFLAMVNP